MADAHANVFLFLIDCFVSRACLLEQWVPNWAHSTTHVVRTPPPSPQPYSQQ
jgi:hypothetical protein